MNVEALAVDELAEHRIHGEAAAWPTDVAAAVVARLKAEADRHWSINANRSLAFAGAIMAIGQARGDDAVVALGTMAHGDALKFVGNMADAWRALDEAGHLFQYIGDDMGWARTRIGRLLLCVDLNRVDEALHDAERARQIFTAHGASEFRLRLDHDTAYVYRLLGNHRHALDLYRSALTTALALGSVGERYLGALYSNLGVIHEALGDPDQALPYLQQAHAFFEATNATRNVAMTDMYIARIVMTQGQYRRALQLLLRTRDIYAKEELDLDKITVDRLLARCYRLLNRHREARDLLHSVIDAYHAVGASYEEALAYDQLAIAEAELGNFDAAQTALDVAQPMFETLGATSWTAITRFRRGRVALQQGDLHTAEHEATAAARSFQDAGQQVFFAQATLLEGQVAFAHADPVRAAHAGHTALAVARRCNVPGLRYGAHLLLGRIAEAQHRTLHAHRRYRAAAATVERMQRGLTITLRPGFLEDKGDALRLLIAMHLRDEQPAPALAALERAKGQMLLGYLANREQLRWSNDERSRALREELAQLRQQHHHLYESTHGVTDDASHPDQAEALATLATLERRMRAITEHLYLHAGSTVQQIGVPSIGEIQQHLQDVALIEYYNDGMQLWAFVLDRHAVTQHRLPCSVAQINHLLAQWQINITAALQLDPHAASTQALTRLAQRILQRLHAALLAPLAPRLHTQRVTVVPYGALHFVPFHLLHNGNGYLLEQHEVVIMPAAGMVLQPAPRRAPSALVLAHSRGGHLPHTQVEAEVVQHLLGGHVLREHEARRAALQTAPCQVLHVAAHGEQRLDHPDLSYVQLADGQVYADDLWQHDLSYELVTLSGCETGRARVAPGDELFGLGQGLLYAGAGAVIGSLWRVRDDAALHVMEHLYRALSTGVGKAAALRTAQQTVLHDDPRLHPAFWGAFQLVGSAAPLSQGTVHSVAMGTT